MSIEEKEALAESIVAEIQRNRINNLLGLIGDDKISVFSNKYGLNETYVSQLKNASRKFGEKAARKIEVYVGLPVGALDINPRKAISALDEDELILAVIAAQDQMTPEGKATLLREISRRL